MVRSYPHFYQELWIVEDILELKYVRKKYIQETTANYEDILTSKEIENFSICEKCTKVIFDKINNNIV